VNVIGHSDERQVDSLHQRGGAIVTSTPLTTSPNGARAEDARDQASALDRSRAKANQAQQTLADASRRVDEIEERLERTTARSSADEKALDATRAEVKRLKKALQDGEKERQKLVLARKRAIADVEKAEDKARKAEAKYDREVLADLIEREKEHDRAAPSAAPSTAPASVLGGPAADAGSLPAVVNSAEPVGDSDPASAPAADVEVPANGQAGAPATEPEDLSTATARTTAARATAAAAGEEAQPAPEPPTPRRSARSRAPRSTASSARASETSDETPSQA
jgi:hypothetical protein